MLNQGKEDVRFRSHLIRICADKADMLAAYCISGAVFFLNYLRLGADPINYGDTAPFPLAAYSAHSAFENAWQNELGNGLGMAGSNIPAAFFNSMLIAVFGSVAAQHILLAGAPAIAILGAYLFLSRLTYSRLVRVYGSLVYFVNPFGLMFFLSGSALTMVYSMLPIAMYAAMELFEGRKTARSVISFGMVLGITTAYNAFAPVFLLPFSLALILLRLSSVKHLLLGSLRLFVGYMISLLLNFPVYVSYTVAILRVLSQKSDFAPSASFSVPLRSAEQAVINDFIYGSQLQQSLHLFWGIIFVVSVITLFRFSLLKNNKVSASVLTLALVLWFWQSGISLKNLWVYRLFPPLYAYDQFKIIMMACAASLAPFGAIIETAWTLRKRIWRLTLTVALISTITLATFAFAPISGCCEPMRFLSGDYYPGGRVDQSYARIAKLLTSQLKSVGQFRFLWLPLDPAVASVLNAYMSNPNLLIVSQDAYEPFFAKDPSFTTFLGEMGVFLIVVDLRVITPTGIWVQSGPARLQPWGPPWNISQYPRGDPVEFLGLIRAQPHLSLLKEEYPFELFVNNDFRHIVEVLDGFGVAPSVLSLSSLPRIDYSYGGNLLNNSDFSGGLEGWSTTGNWTVVHEGKENALEGVGGLSGYIRANQSVKIVPGEYLLKGVMKVNNAVQSHIQMILYSRSGHTISTIELPGISGSTGWKSIWQTFLVPEGVDILRFQLLAGWSQNATRQTSTFYSNVTLSRAYSTSTPSYVQYSSLVSTLLAAGSQSIGSLQLLRRGLGVTPAPKPTVIRITFPLENRTRDLWVYPAGQFTRPVNGICKHVWLDLLEYDLAIVCSPASSVALNIDGPPGYYRMLVLVNSTAFDIRLNGHDLTFNLADAGLERVDEVGFNGNGNDTIIVNFSAPSLFKGIIIVPPNLTINKISNVTIDYSSEPTEYGVTMLQTVGEKYVLLRSTFDYRWKFLGEQEADSFSVEIESVKFNAFLAASSGRISYDGQRNHDLSVFVWKISLVSFSTIWIVTHALPSRSRLFGIRKFRALSRRVATHASRNQPLMRKSVICNTNNQRPFLY